MSDPRPIRKKAAARRKPPLRVQTTTLWEYPSQHYDSPNTGKAIQGSPDYAGATPSWVIWNLLERYTRKGDRVLDPMCGSGTTIDVAEDLGRVPMCFDLAPSRDDIKQADARELPLDNASIDFAFVDPPYSTHIDYSDHPDCIGKLDAGSPPSDPDAPIGEDYYVAMEETISEMHRVLKNRRYCAIYVSDSWKKKKGVKGGLLMPIGFELFAILRDYFQPVDIITVVRHNAKLRQGNWHKAAEKENFFLRGFNYLLIAKKMDDRR